MELELEEPVEGDRLRTRILHSCGEVAHLKDNQKKRLNRILVKGNPGIGKTSLISKLACDWASSPSKSKSEYDLVLVIDFRKIKKGHSLIETVQDQLLTQVSLKDLTVCTSPKHSVLWLFDGYDEASTDFLAGNCSNVKDILESRALLQHCVIVTTRPNKVADFIQKYGKNGQYNHVRVSGFSEAQKVKYISKHFNLNHTYQWLLPLLYMIPRYMGYSMFQRCIQFIFGQVKWIGLLIRVNNSHRVKQLSQFPLFLSMLCVVWEQKNELPTSVTSLYKHMVLMYLAKFRDDKFQSKTSLENVNKILLKTGEVSLDCLFERTFEFSATEKTKSQFDTLIGLGVVVKEGTNLSFLHKTFQELCAAVFWASLAEDNVDKFKTYLRKIDETNYVEMEYLLRLSCGANIKAASIIIDYCVDLMSEVLRKSHKQTSSELCLFGVGSSGNNVVNPWKLPLSLLYEAESQGRESVHDQVEPIVLMLRMHSGRIIPDREIQVIIEHYLNTRSSQTWFSFVYKAVCTFHSEVHLSGVCVKLLHGLSKVRVLHIDGYSFLSPAGYIVCDFSRLMRKLTDNPAVSTTLTELKIARCSINITELIALLLTLPQSCHVVLSIVKVFEKSAQELSHFSVHSVRAIVLHLEGESENYKTSDFNLLFKAFTDFPHLRKSLKEFHCLKLSVRKSNLCNYFASLKSIPQRMSFQQIEVDGTSSAPEHLVKYKFGKLTISGKGAPGYFDCSTWVECFSSCQNAANYIMEFRCIDCFVEAATLQCFFRKCAAIQSLQLHIYKPENARWRDIELHVDNEEMTVSVPDDITKWLRCLNSWCNARNTLKKLLCYFGTVKTNELLHFLFSATISS